METITIRKDTIQDLMRVKQEFDAILESIELMADKEFMKSYKQSKEQVKKQQFGKWDEL